METYICIGKCVPTPASLSRAALPPSHHSFPLASSCAPALFHSPCPPKPPAHSRSSAFPLVPHRSFVPLVPTRDALSSFPAILAISLRSSSRSLARTRAIPVFSLGVPALVARFFLPNPLFFLSTPRSRRVIFIICYLLRHTPPAATVCPARPTRKNRKIEENKRAAGAPCIPPGWRARATVTVGNDKGRPGGTRRAAKGVGKKKKAPRDQRPTRRIIRASACARLSRARGS